MEIPEEEPDNQDRGERGLRTWMGASAKGRARQQPRWHARAAPMEVAPCICGPLCLLMGGNRLPGEGSPDRRQHRCPSSASAPYGPGSGTRPPPLPGLEPRGLPVPGSLLGPWPLGSLLWTGSGCSSWFLQLKCWSVPPRPSPDPAALSPPEMQPLVSPAWVPWVFTTFDIKSHNSGHPWSVLHSEGPGHP